MVFISKPIDHVLRNGGFNMADLVELNIHYQIFHLPCILKYYISKFTIYFSSITFTRFLVLMMTDLPVLSDRWALLSQGSNVHAWPLMRGESYSGEEYLAAHMADQCSSGKAQQCFFTSFLFSHLLYALKLSMPLRQVLLHESYLIAASSHILLLITYAFICALRWSYNCFITLY